MKHQASPLVPTTLQHIITNSPLMLSALCFPNDWTNLHLLQLLHREIWHDLFKRNLEQAESYNLQFSLWVTWLLINRLSPTQVIFDLDTNRFLPEEIWRIHLSCLGVSQDQTCELKCTWLSKVKCEEIPPCDGENWVTNVGFSILTCCTVGGSTVNLPRHVSPRRADDSMPLWCQVNWVQSSRP